MDSDDAAATLSVQGKDSWSCEGTTKRMDADDCCAQSGDECTRQLLFAELPDKMSSLTCEQPTLASWRHLASG